MNTCSCSLSFLVSFCSCKTKTVWKSLPVLLFFPPTDKTWSYFRCYNLLFNHFTTCGFWAWLWCGLCTDKYSTCGIFNSHLEHLFNTSIFMAEIKYIIWVFCLKKNHFKNWQKYHFLQMRKHSFPKLRLAIGSSLHRYMFFFFPLSPPLFPDFKITFKAKKQDTAMQKRNRNWLKFFTIEQNALHFNQLVSDKMLSHSYKRN